MAKHNILCHIIMKEWKFGEPFLLKTTKNWILLSKCSLGKINCLRLMRLFRDTFKHYLTNS